MRVLRGQVPRARVSRSEAELGWSFENFTSDTPAAVLVQRLAWEQDNASRENLWCRFGEMHPDAAAQVVRWSCARVKDPPSCNERFPLATVLERVLETLPPPLLSWEDFEPWVLSIWDYKLHEKVQGSLPPDVLPHLLFPVAAWWCRHAPHAQDPVASTLAASLLLPSLERASDFHQQAFWKTASLAVCHSHEILAAYERLGAGAPWKALAQWRDHPRAQTLQASADLAASLPKPAPQSPRARL